jgi:hypothetical protein
MLNDSDVSTRLPAQDLARARAFYADRAAGGGQPGAQPGEHRRELVGGLGGLRRKRLQNRVLVGQGHELLQLPGSCRRPCIGRSR